MVKKCCNCVNFGGNTLLACPLFKTSNNKMECDNFCKIDNYLLNSNRLSRMTNEIAGYLMAIEELTEKKSIDDLINEDTRTDLHNLKTQLDYLLKYKE